MKSNRIRSVSTEGYAQGKLIEIKYYICIYYIRAYIHIHIRKT